MGFLEQQLKRQYKPGEVIFKDGDPGQTMFIILEGTASIWKGDIRVGTIREGSVFGESVLFLFQNQLRIATVRAETPRAKR